MKFFLSLFIAIFIFASPSFAESCYSKREAEAEQGIRIHSELMVIALNCAHMADANGNNLYGEHKKFTNKHAELFEKYEDIMMQYMEKNGKDKPESAMHLMRTDFANNISKDAAEMRPDIFCNTYSKRIERAAQMDHETLRRWAAMKFPSHPVSQKMCNN